MDTIIDSDEKKAWIVGKVMPHVFNALQSMPGRVRWQKGVCYVEMSRANLEHLDEVLERVTWRGPAQAAVKTYRIMKEAEFEARKRLREDGPGDLSQGFKFKRKPYDHQLKAFNLGRGKTCFGLFMEQGTGKTKVLADIIADLFLNGGEQGFIDTAVIVAPNGVHAQWVNEQLPEHLCEDVRWLGAYTVANPTPDEASRLRKAMSFKGGLRVIAVHVDMLSHKKGQQFIRDLLKTSRSALVVDESSRIKDGGSKRTQFILGIAKMAIYRYIATGTPVSQGVEDLYTQMAFLDQNILGYDSFFAFRNHFCRMGGWKNKKIVGYVNEDELKRKIDSYTFRVLKSDCLDLPPKNFIRREVLFTPEQRKIYDQMRRDFFLELEEGILTAKMAMTRIIRLQQLIGGFIWKREKKDKLGNVVEKELYQEFPNQRVQAALDIINEAQGKVILWIKFEGDYKLLTRAMQEAKIGYVDYVGSTPQNMREHNINRFRNDPDVKVFISSPKSGGIGLNLTAASTAIWYSRDFSLENELQANDRCHRIGQTEAVNYFYLVTPRTIDDRIDKMLQSKKSVAENLIDLRDLFDDS